MVESIDFGYKDTPLGYLSTRMLALGTTPIELRVTRVTDGALLERTKIAVVSPLSIDRRYLYYDSVLVGISKNWWEVRK